MCPIGIEGILLSVSRVCDGVDDCLLDFNDVKVALDEQSCVDPQSLECPQEFVKVEGANPRMCYHVATELGRVSFSEAKHYCQTQLRTDKLVLLFSQF